MLEHRIVVIGNTCAGKTTLGEGLARRLAIPCVDLDALYWGANWQPVETSEFRKRVEASTESANWVVVGSYLKLQQDISWARANFVIWLDIALPTVVSRILVRSYRRWRSGELLWGVNRERFFSQLKIWDQQSSLIAWAVRNHSTKQRAYHTAMQDPRWRHIRFQHLKSTREANRWLSGFHEGSQCL